MVLNGWLSDGCNLKLAGLAAAATAVGAVRLLPYLKICVQLHAII